MTTKFWLRVDRGRPVNVRAHLAYYNVFEVVQQPGLSVQHKLVVGNLLCIQGLCKLYGVQKVCQKEVGRGGHIVGMFRPKTDGLSQSPKKMEVLRDQRSKPATKAIEFSGDTWKNGLGAKKCVGGKGLLGMYQSAQNSIVN